MCGIAGLISTPAGPVASQTLSSFLNGLEHRGPDDSGWLALRGREVTVAREPRGPFVADLLMTHRRLSILDLSESGRQPMGTVDGRYYIVFNGEIYNYLEIREELERLGQEFRSSSDTEVLLTGYSVWGTGVLRRLVGMFAFVIVDVAERTLFLARDFFGIKPLYYTYWKQGFAFASEISPLLELPGVSREANPQRLYDYLRFGLTDHGTETLFLDVKQLQAAHYLEVSLDAPQTAQPVRFWRIEIDQQADLSFDEAAGRLREIFLRNIELHLRSDVPVGAALSGGIDSSSIVMGMRQLDFRMPIHAFSYAADDTRVNEERWVDAVASATTLHLHKVRARPDELLSDLPRLVTLQGELFGSTSIYVQSRVFRQAHEEGIKVMLDGQGADELLGGYHYCIAARLASLLRQGKILAALNFSRRASRNVGESASWLFLQAMDFLLPSRLQKPLRSLVRKEFFPDWLNIRWFDDHAVTVQSFGYTGGRQLLRHCLRNMVEVSLPHLLRYEDRNSMSVSIESRVPFLTPALLEFLFKLPEDYLVAKDGTTKAVFRRAMRGIVPDAILDRRDKIGFATPEQRWLMMLRPWVQGLLQSDAARQVSALDLDEVQTEWDGITAGRRPFDFRVWRWVNTILWVQANSITMR